MTGSGNTLNEPPENRQRHCRTRLVFPAGCGAISVIIVFCSIAIYLRSQARYIVIGPTDPATRIRIEYTVSSRYIKKSDDEDKSKFRSHDAFEDLHYELSVPSPFMRWLRTNILGRSAAGRLESDDINTITQTSSKHMPMAGWYVDPQGFVSVDLKRAKIMTAAVYSQEHKLVGECPTTLVVEIFKGHPSEFYYLLVRPRGQTIIYMFEATSLHLDLLELKAIRDSIRVVKAK